MKKKKIIYFIIALILICGCGAGAAYRIYGNGPKDITEMFFDPESREYIKNMTIYNDEKIELDDYTVTLESSVYDSEVGIGYLVFVIQQNDGKTDNLNKFFEKYSLIDYAGGSGREESVIDGNKMYFYKGLSNTVWAPSAKDKILLVERNKAGSLYEFNLVSISNTKKFEFDKEIVILSHMGIRINRDEFIKPDTVILKYNDGTEDKVIVKEGTSLLGGEDGGGIGGETGNYAYIAPFKNIMDIKNVESVIIDGNEYKPVTE